METTSAAIAVIVTIVMIPAIIWQSWHRNRNDHDNRSDCMCSVILTIPAIIRKSIFSNRDDRSNRMFPAVATILEILTIVNVHMETRFYIEVSLSHHKIVATYTRFIVSL